MWYSLGVREIDKERAFFIKKRKKERKKERTINLLK